MSPFTCKLQKTQKKEKEQEGTDLPPVKEPEIPQSMKDPGTFSGCVIS